ncbi:hypothetical protein B0I37DRAFT_377769 [Chaetomium sp. MPI-CAGE-AT-0009]|nr:hypothetical protein B0I37DRAFT_377769 [Chaetomium sp. MPI-CAGE-AT-0009]
MALDLSRQQERERQALEEQGRLAGGFWEVREKVEKEMTEREKVATERAVRKKVERERAEKEKVSREIEKEKEEAPLRRAVEEGVRREMALRERERLEREMRVRVEEEMKADRQRERERALKEARLKREMDAIKKKAQELEEAAVAKAVEESIMSEEARKLLERRERERRQAEAVMEQRRVETEAKAQTERLRCRVQGQSGSLWAKDGIKTAGLTAVTRPYRPGLPLAGPPVNDPQLSPENTTYHGQFLTAGPYPTTYTDKNGTGPPAPTWYGYNTSPTNNPFVHQGNFGNGNRPTHWNSDTKPALIGETHAADWNNIGTGARHWHETTTERWDAVIHRQNGAHDAYEGYREVSKSTRRFL